MRIAFLGTPEFAVPSLERVVEAGIIVAAVVTQPDRPKGRGKKLAPPPVKQRALEFGLDVHQLTKIKPPEVTEWFRSLRLDAMAVVAYGRIIPQSIIDAPRLGVVNVHASLLPKYRGAAPIQWSIAEGETRTGVTTMMIDAGLDTGDILLAEETPVEPDETAVELSERLSLLGADLLVRTLRALDAAAITPVPQDHEQATFAPVLTKESGRIEWHRPAAFLHNRVRGFQPWPGAYTLFRGQSLHIWKSRLVGDTPSDAGANEPGTLHPVGKRLLVSCGGGSVLEILEVQMEGRKRIPAAAFVNGQHIAQGEKFQGEAG